nr:acyl-ACP thioesterase domain-containing protein [Streptococcus equi]
MRCYSAIWLDLGVTDYDVTIDRMPRFGETVTIETQAISYKNYFVIGSSIFMTRLVMLS